MKIEDNINFVFSDKKFIGFELTIGDRQCCIFLDQKNMPGIRMGKFIQGLENPLTRKTIKDLINEKT